MKKKQQKQTMKIEEARSANQTAWFSLYEAITLNDVADVVRSYHDGHGGECDQIVEKQVDVLKNMIGERVNIALKAVYTVKEYFGRLKKEPKEKTRKVTPENLQIAINRTKNREVNVKHLKSRLLANLQHKRTEAKVA